MASNVVSLNKRPMQQRRTRRNRNGAALAAAAPPPTRYFEPERAYLTARDAEIRRVGAMAKQALSLVNSEKNFLDVSGSVNPVVTPTAQCLTAIAQGDDDGQRQGSSVRAKSIDIRLNFYSATAATNSQVVRVFIVKDNLPNGTVPTTAQVFQTSPGILAFPTLDTQQGRFTWLYDEMFTLGTVAGGQDAKVLVISQKLDHVINYISSAGTTAAAGQGTLWLFVLTDTVSGNASTGAFYSRLRYYDN